MKPLLIAIATLASATIFAQQATPPESKSNIAKFLATPGTVFVTESKFLGTLNIKGSMYGSDVRIDVNAVVIWDYTSPEKKLKAIKFGTLGFYEGWVDVFIDDFELTNLQKYFGILDQEAAQNKPSGSDSQIGRQVNYKSRSGLYFECTVKSYISDGHVRVGIFDSSTVIMTKRDKELEKMKTLLTTGAKWLEDYPQKVSHAH
jgi:hypothetical protein